MNDFLNRELKIGDIVLTTLSTDHKFKIAKVIKIQKPRKPISRNNQPPSWSAQKSAKASITVEHWVNGLKFNQTNGCIETKTLIKTKVAAKDLYILPEVEAMCWFLANENTL